MEIEEFLVRLGIEIVPINRDLAVLGGLFKAKYSKSKKGFAYGDAFILALAIERNATIYTFDPEFEGIDEVPIKK